MTHHIIKSLLFSASLSKVHRTFFTLALGATLLAGCGKDNKDVKSIGVTDVHTTGCLQSKLLEDEEAWQVYWDQGKLRVHHLGWMVPRGSRGQEHLYRAALNEKFPLRSAERHDNTDKVTYLKLVKK